ncbi:Na(+)/H(+) antiporter subunit B [Geomicrobium sediminis]|uniref:Multicomponent Na+:H+ antiporter subunit B n=1 Tax=Geomicrobium sediminis TaxID=1347788 RepID=A0ABS2PG41_9BACL|nr:multicomponent Na+:H+ antiporter subunit B [Geomicrobium sediminis]
MSMKWKTNNLLFIHITRVTAFLILALSIYLFFAGHNNPGGGFIGGLMLATSILLLYLTFDRRKINKMLPMNYANWIGAGILISLLTGLIGTIVGKPYLTQFFDYFTLPFFGEFELTTAVLFDFGIYLGVGGSALIIILAIAEDT